MKNFLFLCFLLQGCTYGQRDDEEITMPKLCDTKEHNRQENEKANRAMFPNNNNTPIEVSIF